MLLLLIGIRGTHLSLPLPQPHSITNRRGFVGECEGVQHPESRRQQLKRGHGDSEDTWPLPGKRRGMLLEGQTGREMQDAGEAGRFALRGAVLCSDLGTQLSDCGSLCRDTSMYGSVQRAKGQVPGDLK